ncbi:hypothetical protein EUGRSUZ_B02317 [Eucalyptus grandis]|uniref:Uncharacterized protein n=2 Tax=Eucalyptus grandis TaxID=71139 RepID=A0ACC3LT40_EUCGR|nr:hypothetical protein EUGRSUZ_B02317 [Eucalyptus grandis]
MSHKSLSGKQEQTYQTEDQTCTTERNNAYVQTLSTHLDAIHPWTRCFAVDAHSFLDRLQHNPTSSSSLNVRSIRERSSSLASRGAAQRMIFPMCIQTIKIVFFTVVVPTSEKESTLSLSLSFPHYI